MEKNKYYPQKLKEAVLKSLSFYPELAETEIHFRFARNLQSSVMQAQPIIRTVFRPRLKRSYVIRMRRQFTLEGKLLEIDHLPPEVLVGWFGHELGHILDYRNRSFSSLLAFGFSYLFSRSFRKKAERTADTFAVRHGMIEYLQATKQFILQNSCFSERYKAKIRRLYVSPEKLVDLVQKN